MILLPVRLDIQTFLSLSLSLEKCFCGRKPTRVSSPLPRCMLLSLCSDLRGNNFDGEVPQQFGSLTNFKLYVCGPV